MIITLVLRFVQFLFAVIVLGLAVTLIKDQVLGGSPAAINYAAFTGGFGIIGAAVGIAALFVGPLGGLVMAAIDGLASLFYLAGGIAIVVILRGISCSSTSNESQNKMYDNTLLNGGCTNYKGQKVCGYIERLDHMNVRCRENEADAAFMFMSFALCIGCAVLSFLAMNRGTGRKGALV
ncbi:hypothetical protein AOQ84DRAFT_164846 [Glonium stellatum]|uniref:MARVEL domain-containing protein n=1 Tax=Glonium stellatum TaxID=574774 RepID=A0A8E2JMJ9_9PEZI|nr:hypothetical protein AOQ84DRAFT_164846 [Glonium stellatum]